ncbi:hypothetical protein BC834DRAFT_843385 [Gloeopeniophorella convolvens]|nr:hypothetical protein BC834DRAFT_843385 [Gloeopeniophorella convolvens]
MANFLPKSQTKLGDRYLSEARDVRDQWKDIIQPGDLEMILNRITVCKDVFPTPEKEESWVNAVWVTACTKAGVEISQPEDLAEALMTVSSCFRSEVKQRVQPLVTARDPESLGQNAKLARSLKTTFGDGTDGLPYRHPVIQEAINIIWFDGRESDGTMFPNHFFPMPYEAIALVLAVIECCIDQWCEGSHIEIPFAYEYYADIYHHHLSALKSLQHQGLESRSCDPLYKLRQEFYNAGRQHAGPLPLRTDEVKWSQDRVDAACLAASQGSQSTAA